MASPIMNIINLVMIYNLLFCWNARPPSKDLVYSKKTFWKRKIVKGRECNFLLLSLYLSIFLSIYLYFYLSIFFYLI